MYKVIVIIISSFLYGNADLKAQDFYQDTLVRFLGISEIEINDTSFSELNGEQSILVDKEIVRFDKDGNVVQKDYNIGMFIRFEFEYDEYGSLKSEKVYGEPPLDNEDWINWGTREKPSEYPFDFGESQYFYENEKLVLKTIKGFPAPNHSNVDEVYKYNVNGQLSSKIQYDSIGNILDFEMNKYSKNQVLLSSLRRWHSNLVSKTYTYNTNLVLSTMKIERKNKKVVENYDIQNGRIHTQYIYYSDSLITWVDFEYNEDGYLVIELFFSIEKYLKKDLVKKNNYFYNQQNLLIRRDTYCIDPTNQVEELCHRRVYNYKNVTNVKKIHEFSPTNQKKTK